MNRLPLAAVVGLWLWLAATAVEAKHQPLLPGLCGQTVDVCPTPHIVKAQTARVVTYRLDAGTSVYPGFRQEAADVAAAWFDAVGVEAREITEGTPDLWLTFPADSAFLSVCGDGAAACIQYWADPVMVYFRRALLYSDWKTALSHEGINGGHALGEGEAYFDEGEFRCDTAATYTVMSCGTGVWLPQPFDVDLVCRVLKGCNEWRFDAARGEWVDRNGESEWCCRQPFGGYNTRRGDFWRWDKDVQFTWRESDPVWRLTDRAP